MSTPRQRLSPEERRAQIAGAARSLALEEGLIGLTQRSVAARAGVTGALVAHYAESMDHLVADVFSRIVGAELEEIRAEHGADATAKGFEEFVLSLLDGGRAAVTRVWVDAFSLGRRNEPLAEAVRVASDAWQELLAGFIDARVAAGVFACPDASVAAWHLMGFVDGLNSQSLVSWGDAAARADLTLPLVRRLVISRVHTRGLEGPERTP
ncbi:TetR/AcrR family transcriptional regulator [Galactobacter valiniphilus]|uniref:TetR/AcrR family transcriptional regulator n=1 Tax=Galactobacter valiniphilus TaxID=2676122 RepID=UPI0037353ED5